MKNANELKEPYIKALKKIGSQLKYRQYAEAAKETNTSIPTFQLAVNGHVLKFETAERIINWGIKNKML